MLPIAAVLHPTDFSAPADPAFEIARALARDYGAKLWLLHVVPDSSLAALEGAVSYLPEEELAAKGKLHQLAARVTGVLTETAAVRGHPAEEVVAFAERNKVDLIVMGTHGHTGLARLLMGSVAEHVLRHAPCPVLTVRAPFPRATSEKAGS